MRYEWTELNGPRVQISESAEQYKQRAILIAIGKRRECSREGERGQSANDRKKKNP